MAEAFVCSVCGEEHVGLPTDWAFTLPDDVWNIPEPQRSEAAKFNKDLCQLGERYFIRCVLEIPFMDRDGFFAWGAWAEVQWTVFEKYLEVYEADGCDEPREQGTLANSLRAYATDTICHPVSLQFRESTRRPALYLTADDDSALAQEQRKGIDSRRYHEILEAIGA